MPTNSKIVDKTMLLTLRQGWREQNRMVVWTNGCFDLLHPGHVASLQAARALGDRLVVGINSDSSVAVNKGPSRPILNQHERATMLAALECVDAVLVFDELTPAKVLSELTPEIHCKGAEYAPPSGRPVPEAETVRGYGGRIAYLPLVPGISTTELLRRIERGLARAA